MKYLLDVNALLALAFQGHEFHGQVLTWVDALTAKRRHELLFCAIAEMGFVRILPQLRGHDLTVADGRDLLTALKARLRLPFSFLPDDHGADRLPDWVKTPRQTTDGHLAELAAAHGAALATLDEGIPGAFLIPHLPAAPVAG